MGEREALSLSSCGSERLHPGVAGSVGFGLGLTKCGSKMLLPEADQLCRIRLWLAGPLQSRMGKLRPKEVQSFFQGHPGSLGLRTFKEPTKISETLKYLLAGRPGGSSG